MVKIQCLACDKTLVLPQFVNTNNYDGQVVCQECKSLLYLKLVEEELLKYKIVENKAKGFDFTELALRLQEERNQQKKAL
jgi:hypothetical protein